MSNNQTFPRWAMRLYYRLAGLKEPGIYHVIFVVGDKGVRRIAVLNADKPAKIENISDPEQETGGA